MKKFTLLSVICLIAAWNVSMAQIAVQSNPLPSFNYPLYNTTAVFQEEPGNETFEKRDGNVVITSTYDNTGEQIAIVTFTNLSNNDVLGPFTVKLNEHFIIKLGKGCWKATVSSPSALNLSIWLDKEKE